MGPHCKLSSLQYTSQQIQKYCSKVSGNTLDLPISYTSRCNCRTLQFDRMTTRGQCCGQNTRGQCAWGPHLSWVSVMFVGPRDVMQTVTRAPRLSTSAQRRPRGTAMLWAPTDSVPNDGPHWKEVMGGKRVWKFCIHTPAKVHNYIYIYIYKIYMYIYVVQFQNYIRFQIKAPI